ncbi:ABC transporter permease [Alkalibacter rhizosphaerae]|uniref:ABC transporter permease n=1 Tax=Alkalibacter rhizosphaerae TaxID=2815577 RepID=A0A975AIN1_9FIRM|nr:ABC transporter permease [Alkalibacter rhizosphaerae]QSX08844.1 ABC transporter permease [Alkalibacter rhizosphaerae]
MKKILAIVRRDVKSGTRDWLILYLSIAPILFALVIKALIPGVESSTLNVVLLEDVDKELSGYVENYAEVEYVDSMEAMEERVLRMDDIYGVTEGESEVYRIIRQGNEVGDTHEVLSMLLDQLAYEEPVEMPVDVRFSDVGWEMSPLKLYGGNMIILFTTVLGGMLILLNLVEEKMSNTISAVNVSPVTRVEFVIGKGMLGFLLALLGSLAVVWILNFGAIRYDMLLVSLISIAFISVIIGFSIGVVHNEPIAAIASMKVTFVPVLASVFGAMYLPDKWQFVLYWSPFYWAYDSIRDILLQTADWPQVLRNSLLILVLTSLVFLALRKRISQGLR